MKHLTNIVATLLALASSSLALGEMEVRSSFGYGVLGRFQGASDVAVQSNPISLALNFETKYFGPVLMIGSVFQHHMVSYSDDGVTHSGTNLLAGVVMGFNVRKTETRAVRIEGAYYPYNELTLSSDSRGTVNEESFLHSSLSTYKGPGAMDVRIVYLWELAKGQFNPRERLRYGIALTQFIQPLNQWEVTTATSNSDLAPEKKTKADVDYTLSVTSLDFQVGFVF